jgi:PAS domain S-box-containing protein
MSKSNHTAEPKSSKPKAEEVTSQYQAQFDALFSDRLPLNGDPAVNNHPEVAALQARIAELESKLTAQAAIRPPSFDYPLNQFLDDERYKDLFDNTANLIQNVAMDGSFIYVNRAWLETLGYTQAEVAELNLFNIIHPNSQGHCMALFQQIQQGSQSVFVEADFVTKSGQPIAIEGTTSTLFKDGQPVSTRGIFVNVTGRKQVNTLYQVSQAINDSIEPEQVYAATRAAVEQLMPAEAFFIALINESRTEIEDVYMYDRGQRYPNERTSMSEGGIAVHVATTGQSIFIKDDIANASAIPGRVLYGTGQAPRSIMALPLQSGGKTIGALSVQSYQPNVYTENHLQILSTLATHVAAAIERARLLENLRHEAEERKKQSTELSALFSAMTDLIMVFDADGRYLQIAPTNPSLLIKPSGDLLGKTMFDVMPPAKAEELIAPVRKALTDKQATTFEYMLPIADQEVWFEATISPLTDTTVFWVARDITERRRATTALSEAEAVFRHAIEAAGAVPYRREHGSNKYLYMGDGIKAILGYSAEEMDAALLDSLVIETEMAGDLSDINFDAALDNARSGRVRQWHANIHLRTRDGGSRWVADSSTEIVDETGHSVGSLGFMQDITERKQSEAALRASEAQLAEALRIARLGNWEYDFLKDEFTFNDAFYAMMRTSAEREGGYKMNAAHYTERFVYPEDAPLVGIEIGKSIETTDPNFSTQLDHRVFFGDGQLGYVSVRFRIAKDAAGRTVKSFGVNQDITERKKFEEQVLHQAAELQAVADISTAASTTTHEQETLEKVVNLAKERFNLYHAHVYLLDEDQQTLVLTASAGEIGKQMVAAGRVIPLHHPNSPVARAARTASGVIANDVTQEPDFLPNPLLPDTRSELATPIMVGTQVLGVFDVQADVVDRFTEQDVAIETTLARQIGSVLQNVRSLERAERAIAELGALTRRLIREGWTEYQQRQIGREAFVYEPPRASDNGHTGPATETQTIAASLKVRGEAIGELELASPVETEEAQAITQAIAERLSAHLENLRLTEQTQLALSQAQKRAVEIQTVAEVTTATSTILERDQLLERAVQLTQRRFDLYHCHVYLFDLETDTLSVMACGWSDEDAHEAGHSARTISIHQERSLVAEAARERKPVAVNDAAHALNWAPDVSLPETRSELAIPMTIGDTLIGVFAAQSERTNRFTSEDIQAFITLTNALTIAVQNAQLYSDQIHAANRLREMDRLKSTFLANMSHELRTPLNSVIGYTDVILEGLDGPLTEQMEVDLKTIQRNGQHLLNLINDVLDMAKIESGKLSLAVRPFDLRDVLTDIIDITSPLARDRNVELRLNVASPTLNMEGDDMRLRQVTLNIVNNAIKFTESGGHVDIQAERINGHVRVKVHDNGIGIPPDKLDLIFQEFTQVDSSTTRKVGGTGLGLPISRHLVALHGGRLWAESTGVRGEGATFTFEVPVESQIGEEAAV